VTRRSLPTPPATRKRPTKKKKTTKKTTTKKKTKTNVGAGSPRRYPPVP
jgi:hypothetical protein